MTAMPVGTAAATRRPGPSRWLIVALALSLVLNLCFVAGAVWTRLHRPGGDWVRETVTTLHLNAEQETALRRFVQDMRTRTDRMRDDVGPLIGNAWTEIAKPQPDEAQIMRLFDQAADKRHEFQRDATTETLNFLATLSPDQREKFVGMMRERRAPWMRSFRNRRAQ